MSLLEPESELYNSGITDVSYRYPKMYVVRPQCFMSIITLLASANKNVAQFKRQLVEIQNRDIDVKNFEKKLSS